MNLILIPTFEGQDQSETLFVPCPRCGNGVPVRAETQLNLSQGGVGHKCPSCQHYIAIVQSTCCNGSFLLDDEEWDILAKDGAMHCPLCGATTNLPAREPIILAMNFVESWQLTEFSSQRFEEEYILAAKGALGLSTQKQLAIYHRTTFERLTLSMKGINIISTANFHSSFGFFNTKDFHLLPAAKNDITLSELSDLVFQVASAIFSAIESVTHEINICIGSPWRERDVSYKKLKAIPARFVDIKNLCESFIGQPEFDYLHRLRNVTMHRRVTTLAVSAQYSIELRQSIKPHADFPKCIYYLPDSPDVEPGKESFVDKHEVSQQLKLLLTRAQEFTVEAYRLLAIALKYSNRDD